MAPSPPPLSSLRVLELAGLAPGPYAGLLLADHGASVLRIDRPGPSVPTPDNLTRRKASLALDLKSSPGRSALLALAARADVLIDPFRPGVLEGLGLGPETLRAANPRLIVARMTGFRREGKYRDMAGHDINYLAVSGALAMLGRRGETPYAPGNLLGDFAGGGLVLFTGILLALAHRERTGQGQVVEANMVDGVAHLATFPRLAQRGPMWDRGRGENFLDGGCPWYDTYTTKDGRYMAVGALEPQFFAKLVEGLGLDGSWNERRMDREEWNVLRTEMTEKFKSKTRKEWEEVFDGTDACCTPVLDHAELEKGGYDQRPLVTLRESPALSVQTKRAGHEGRDAAEGQGRGVEGSGWRGVGLAPGEGGEEVLQDWMGWQRDKQYDIVKGSLMLRDGTAKAKL